MCTNRACYEGECESCRKIDRMSVGGLLGNDGKLLFRPYKEPKVERTLEQEADSKVFLEKMLIKAQLAGDIYRNNLKNLYSTGKGAFYE